MTGFNHLATGAAIAVIAHSPAVALPAALASHFILDALPHYGVDHHDPEHSRFFWRVISIDLAASILLTISIVWLTRSWLFVGCMLAAISPDFVWFAKFGLDRLRNQPFALPKDLFSRLHKNIQWGERSWGWGVELVYALGVIGLLVRILKK